MDDVTVSFRYDTAHITLNYTLNYPKALLDLPQANLKKLFEFMVSDWHREAHAEAVRITHEQLTAYVEETKQAWAEASKVFQDCYVDTKYHYGRDKKAAAVKSAKAKNMRAKKLLTFFEEVKSKYFD